MGSFIWYLTKSRESLLNRIEKIPEFGKKAKSEILEDALEEHLLRHEKSENPQTKMDLYQNPHALAIPNIYSSKEEWIKFYEMIKKDKQAFLELDIHLDIVKRTHESYASVYGLRLPSNL